MRVHTPFLGNTSPFLLSPLTHVLSKWLCLSARVSLRCGGGRNPNITEGWSRGKLCAQEGSRLLSRALKSTTDVVITLFLNNKATGITALHHLSFHTIRPVFAGGRYPTKGVKYEGFLLAVVRQASAKELVVLLFSFPRVFMD